MNKLFISIAMLTFITAGCDDEPTVVPDTSVADTNVADTNVADTNVADTNGADAADAAETAVSPALCMNAADFDICNTCGDADGPVCGDACPSTRAFAQSEATGCGLGCIQDADPRQCAVDCILPATGLTADCGGCYADIVLCSVNNCLASCLTPSSPACQQCQAENCVPAFNQCTGFESSCDDTVDNNGDGNTDCTDPSCDFSSACP